MKALLLTACFAAISISVARPADTTALFPPLQFDEISRTVMPGSSPAPPPDAFAIDSAQVQGGKIFSNLNTQQQAPPMPHPQFGLGNILGAIFNPVGALMGMGEEMLMGAIMGGMTHGASQGMQHVESGRESHVAYYQQYMRYENLADNTVTLYDAQTQKRTQIDIAKRQYTVTSGNAEQAMPADAMPAASAAQGGSGSANVEMSTQRSQGNDATIAGVPATEYDETTTVSITGAGGSCKSLTMQFQTVEYVAKTMLGPGFSSGTFTKYWVEHPEMLAGEGCTATVHSSPPTGPAVPPNHMVLYSRTLFAMPGVEQQTGHQPPHIYMVMERGNIRPVTAGDAAALFTVPAGFTQQ